MDWELAEKADGKWRRLGLHKLEVEKAQSELIAAQSRIYIYPPFEELLGPPAPEHYHYDLCPEVIPSLLSGFRKKLQERRALQAKPSWIDDVPYLRNSREQIEAIPLTGEDEAEVQAYRLKLEQQAAVIDLTTKRKAELLVLVPFMWRGMTLSRMSGKGWRVESEESWLARILAAEYLGRKLERNESVRHKDGNPFNNLQTNLQIVPALRGRPKRCKACGKEVGEQDSRRCKVDGTYMRFCLHCLYSGASV